MTPEAWERTSQRLFGYQHGLNHPVVLGTVVAVMVLVMASAVALQWLRYKGHVSRQGYRDALLRWHSWIVISAAILVPILLGAAATMIAVTVLSLACFFEYARATGLTAEKTISAAVVAGTMLVAFAIADHYERLFFAAAPLTVITVAIVTIPQDRPQNYIRRVAVGTFGFLMFGFSLGYMGNLANIADLGNGADYRPVLVLILVGVAANDIVAYCVGKAVGRAKLLPRTSPGKTIAGSLAALLLVSPLLALLAHFVLRETPADRWTVLATLGLGISVLGQLGDLVVSSIKRDIGIKDMGTIISGHGGILDRFDSLILVPPAVYHYLAFELGPLAAEEPIRILSGAVP